MATVDSLDIQISAEVKKANASIDLLVKRLDRLSASLSGVNARGLATLGSGVNKLSNAMNNFSKNTKISDFTKLTSSLKKLNDINVTSINAVSPAIERIAKSMDSIGSLNFGNNSKQVASMVKSLGSLNKINSTSIKNATDAIGKIAGAMNGIKSMNFGDNSTKIAELARSISNLGGKSATTAISNIPKLADAMKKFMQTLSTAPKVSQNLIDMTNAMAKFARTGSSGGRAAVSLGNNISNMAKKLMCAPKSINMFNKSITTSVFSMNKLKGSISSFLGMFGGIYAVFNGLKESVNISSDLTEVQNVVDTAFGKYKNTIEKFSKTSIQDFGMSELTAKTIAGRFQSMGSAMGFAQKDMAKMSVSLTGLAGDMASFYNVSQEEMGKSLQSIFTGETEPMRKYGVDLTNATIQQWAMKRGIDANVNSMTQMEKTMLRYQYVMAQTGAAQGDFLRTQDTWANQIRLLAENFKVLGGIVGGVIINSFKPFIKSLNVVMEQVNNFAKIISDALGKIFGWTYEEGGGSSNPASDMASSMGDLSDATENATKKQKELNRQLGKFDELNNYSKPSDSSGDNGGSANLGITSSDGGSGGKWKQGKSMIKSFESEIDTLYKLGKKISDTLKGAMDSINWDSIYQKAENFGTGLATFLNGLISPELFSSLGTTVANSLTTALEGLNSFGKTFDWSEFGTSLSEGLKSFFKDFDWDLAVDTFNTFANGVLDSIIAGLDNISAKDWQAFAQKIANLIAEIDVSGITFKVGKIANKLVQAFYNVVSEKDTWINLGKKIADGINGFFKGMNDVDKETGLTGWEALGKSISNTIKGFSNTIITALSTVKWEDVGQAVADFITSIDWSGIAWSLIDVVSSFASALKKALKGGGMNDTLADLVVNVGIGGWVIKKLSKTKLGEAILGKLGDKISVKIKDATADIKNWAIGKWNGSKLKEKLSKKANGIKVNIKKVTSTIKKWVVDVLSKIKAKLAVQSAVPNKVSKKKVDIDIKKFGTSGKIPNLSIPKLTGEIKNVIPKIGTTVKKSGFLTKIKDALGIVKNSINLGSIATNLAVTLGSVTPGPVSDEIVRNFDTKIATPFLESLPGYDKELGAFNLPKQIVVDFPIALGNIVIDGADDIGSKLQGAFDAFMTGGKGGKPSITALVNYLTNTDEVEETNEEVSKEKTTEVKYKALTTEQWKKAYKKFNGISDKKTTWELKLIEMSQNLKNALNNPLLSELGKKNTLNKKIKIDIDILSKGNSAERSLSNALADIQKKSVKKKADGGIFKNGKWSEVTKYAVGGFPNQGQMFIAREAGPELVGTIGGSTAVVNNQQIVASVSEGVAKAVASVIAPMISYNSQGGDVVVQIDGQTVAKAVRKQNTDFRRRTGRGMFD